MKQPTQEDLLGYVLGALDAQEQRDLQEKIDADPMLEERLLEIRHAMSPMESLDAATPGQRPGLARRTCELVASLKHGGRELLEDDDHQIRDVFEDEPAVHADSGATKVTRTPASHFSDFSDRLFHPLSWSRVDMLAAVACLAILSGILLPAISQSRFHSRVLACQNNLTEVGTAMLNYSDLHGSSFIKVPAGRDSLATQSLNNVSFASGLYAPVLKSSGFVKDDASFSCAGVSSDVEVCIPTVAQLDAAEGEQRETLLRRMGGHFGFGLGFVENNHYVSLRNDGSAHRVMLADMPSSDLPGRSSRNHSGRGQNCFFADGHVKFIVSHAIGQDAIYENDFGMVGPGAGPRDNVIAPSHLPPVRIEYLTN